MIYTTKVIHKTQGEAIADGVYQARSWAYKNGMPGYAEIALNNGKSLVVKSTPNGKITKYYSDGWNKGGMIFMSEKVAKQYDLKR